MTVQPLRRFKAVFGTLCIMGLLASSVVGGAVIIRRGFEVNFPGVDSVGNLDFDHQVISTKSLAYFNTRNKNAFLLATAHGVQNLSGARQVFLNSGNSVYAGPDVNLTVNTTYGRYVVNKRGYAVQYGRGKIVTGNVVP